MISNLNIDFQKYGCEWQTILDALHCDEFSHRTVSNVISFYELVSPYRTVFTPCMPAIHLLFLLQFSKIRPKTQLMTDASSLGLAQLLQLGAKAEEFEGRAVYGWTAAFDFIVAKLIL